MDENQERLLIKAIHSYRYYVDEIIVSEDGGRFCPQVMALSDIYCYSHHNLSFTKNVNRGWNLSTGDFTAIVNSDTYHLEGDLRKLCIEGKVTSPEIKNQSIPNLAGPFWVVPREIKAQRGILLEEMKTYNSDSEYDNRVRDVFQKVPEVVIWHYMATTVKLAGAEKDATADQETYVRLKQEGKAK